MRNKKRITPGAPWGKIFALGLVFCLGLCSGTAWAHKVNVYAYQEGGTIKGEGYFAGGDKAQNCAVEVLDDGGRLVASGQTNPGGDFSLALAQGAKPPLRVTLKASMGHQGEYTISAAEMAGAPETPAAKAPEPAGRENQAAGDGSWDEARQEALLGRMLDQRLGPLTAQISKMNADKGVTANDIFGGVGYIVGLLGLAAYIRYRKK